MSSLNRDDCGLAQHVVNAIVPLAKAGGPLHGVDAVSMARALGAATGFVVASMADKQTRALPSVLAARAMAEMTINTALRAFAEAQADKVEELTK